MRKLEVRCISCDVTFVADSTRHHLDRCPKCNYFGVDLEEEYCRIIGNVEVVREL